MDPPRKRLARDYQFGTRIGEGLYSTVYLAVDLHTKKTYAVKILSKRHIVKEDKIKYVNIEKTTLHRLGQQHPGVVQLFYTFQDENSLFFVLDFAEYGELLLMIRKLGLLLEPLAKFYTCQIVDAVKFIHSKGVIHRDLKPENILVGHDFNLKITDFGAAKLLELETQDDSDHVNYDLIEGTTPPKQDESNRRGSFVGTAEYVAPELLKYNECGFELDVWAIGCIVYQFFCGTPAFKAETEYLTFEKIISGKFTYTVQLPPDVTSLIDHILVEDINYRYTIDQIQQAPWFLDVKWEPNYIWGRKVPRFELYNSPSGQPYVPTIKTGRNVNKLSLYHTLHSQIKQSDIYVPLVGSQKKWQQRGGYLKIPPTPQQTKPAPANLPGAVAGAQSAQAVPSGGPTPPPTPPQLQPAAAARAMAAAAQPRPVSQVMPPASQAFGAMAAAASANNGSRYYGAGPGGLVPLPMAKSPASKPRAANMQMPHMGAPLGLGPKPAPMAPQWQSQLAPAAPISDHKSQPVQYQRQGPYGQRGTTNVAAAAAAAQGHANVSNSQQAQPATQSSTQSGIQVAQSQAHPQAKPSASATPIEKATKPSATAGPLTTATTSHNGTAKASSSAPTTIRYAEIVLLLHPDEKILKLDTIFKSHLKNLVINRDVNVELDDVSIEHLVHKHAKLLAQEQVLVVAVITNKARVFFIDSQLNVMLVDLKANYGADYSMYDYDFEYVEDDPDLKGEGYLILELIKEGGDLVFLQRNTVANQMLQLQLQSNTVQVVDGNNVVRRGASKLWIESLLTAKDLVAQEIKSPTIPQQPRRTPTPPLRSPTGSSPSSASLGQRVKRTVLPKQRTLSPQTKPAAKAKPKPKPKQSSAASAALSSSKKARPPPQSRTASSLTASSLAASMAFAAAAAAHK